MIVHRARRRLLPLLGLSLLALAACKEDLSGGAACPTLCPGQQLEVHDTILVAREVFDTMAVVNGMPPLGTETQLLVARYKDAQGDSIVSGAVMRYDSLQRVFPRADTTKPFVAIASVSSALLQFTSNPDTSVIRDSLRFEVFDADANVPDLDTATIHQLFLTRPAIGTLNVNRDSVPTQHSVPLDTTFIRQHLTTPGARIRLGLRLFSYGHDATGNAQVGIIPVSSTSTTSGAQTGPNLQYEAHAAAGGTTDSLNFINYSLSKSSGGPEFKYLANYQLVLKGSPPAATGLLPVGGLPSSRVYLRFDLPSALIDSSATIVRATLLVHQQGDLTFQDLDSISLTPRVVIASPAVTDISKATILLAETTTLPLPSVRVNPKETRTDTLVLVSKTANVVALWRAEGPLILQRAIVLQSSGEGRDARRFLLYSNAAVDSLRPRLHLTYIPRSGFGLP